MNPELQRLIDRHLLWVVDPAQAKTGSSKNADSSSNGAGGVTDGQAVSFGAQCIDSVLPGQGLLTGSIHEWFFDLDSTSSKVLEKDERAGNNTVFKKRWYSPFLVPCSLLSNISRTHLATRKAIVWIGRNVWPNPDFLRRTLCASGLELVHSGLAETRTRPIFVDLYKTEDRLWTAVEVLRSRVAQAVICDARGFNLRALRQLQIAAREGGGLGLLFRPPWEINRAGFCATSWLLSPCLPQPFIEKSELDVLPVNNMELFNSGMFGMWRLELLRARGVQTPRAWQLSVKLADYGQKYTLSLSADDIRRSVIDAGTPNTEELCSEKIRARAQVRS